VTPLGSGTQGPSVLPAMGVHVTPEHGVHPGLVSGTLGLEPVDHVPIQPNRQLMLGFRKPRLDLTPVERPFVIDVA